LTSETFKLTIASLLNLAREKCWNTFSDDCVFIFTEIINGEFENFRELKKETKNQNAKKKPVSFDQALETLRKLYADIYDVNFYVYRALSNKTIVEIQYYPKSSLDMDFFVKVKNNEPMVHCKIEMPPYQEENKKFDINWLHGGFLHNWRMFKWRREIKRIKQY
jgi:hypothetical protein